MVLSCTEENFVDRHTNKKEADRPRASYFFILVGVRAKPVLFVVRLRSRDGHQNEDEMERLQPLDLECRFGRKK